MKGLTSIPKHVGMFGFLFFLFLPLFVTSSCTGRKAKPLLLRLVFSNEAKGYLDPCG